MFLHLHARGMTVAKAAKHPNRLENTTLEIVEIHIQLSAAPVTFSRRPCYIHTPNIQTCDHAK